MLVTVTIDGEDKQTPTLSQQDMSKLTELVAKLVQEHLQASPSGSIDDDNILALTANQTFDQEIRRIIQEHLPNIDLAGTLGLNPYQDEIQRLEEKIGEIQQVKESLTKAISAIEELYQATGNPSPEERERIRQQRESDNNSNYEAISRGEAQPLDTSLSDFKLINLLDEINAIRQFVRMKKINSFG